MNFVVINNNTGSAVPSRLIRDAISGKFKSQLCGISLSIEEAPPTEESINNAVVVVLKNFTVDKVGCLPELGDSKKTKSKLTDLYEGYIELMI